MKSDFLAKKQKQTLRKRQEKHVPTSHKKQEIKEYSRLKMEEDLMNDRCFDRK